MTTDILAGQGYVPGLADSLEFLDSLADSEEWRSSQVKHWHMTRSESATGARDRFERDRWEAIVGKPAEVATTPYEALAWMLTQQCEAIGQASDPAAAARRLGWRTWEDWEARQVVSWETLTCGMRVPSGFGMAVRDGYSIEIYANPVTAYECTRH